MTITTTNGERFTDEEHAALARLMFKRFGKEEGPFCNAWRRMLQNNSENADIMRLTRESRPQERAWLEQDIRREGTAEVRDLKLELLDVRSCEILRRHLKRVADKGERDGVRKMRHQPWKLMGG